MRIREVVSSIALAALLGSACAEPTTRDARPDLTGDQPTVTVVTASIQPPGSLQVRLENPTYVEYGFNLCAHGRLQRADGDAWVDLGEPLWVCTAELSSLRPGETREGTYGIAVGTTAGAYRMKLRLMRDGPDDVVLYSNRFVVR